jgi:biotin-dependent carboxylase-like uncharacterized protein
MTLTIRRAGPQTLIVDQGRYGFQHLGVSPAECQDLHGFLWANKLLGNPANTPALEVTFGQFEIQTDAPLTLTVTGAQCPLKINGQSAPQWQTLSLGTGDTFSIGAAQKGLHAYLAIAGGFDMTPQLGSFASSPREGLGPFQGSPLMSGTALSPQKSVSCNRRQANLSVPSRYIPDYSKPLTLDLIPGYQFSQFSHEAIDTLLTTTYQVGAQSDRMGYRLQGASIMPPPQPTDSQGIALGCVQVPENGQPIVLQGSRQTIGGYAKLGCVSRGSLSALAQRRPSQPLSFRLSDWQSEFIKLQKFWNFFS